MNVHDSPDTRVLHDEPLAMDIGPLADFIAYFAALSGFLMAVLAASHRTLLGFVLVAASTLCWIGLFWYLSHSDVNEWQLRAVTVGFIVFSLVPALAVFTGMYFDWLLPVVTVAVFAIMYPLRTALILSGIVVVAITAFMVILDRPSSSSSNFLQDVATLLPAFAFAFTFMMLLRRAQSQRERAEQLVSELEETQAQLRAYAEQAEELAVSRERNRLAREIHDTLGHYLTILAVQLETALKLEERGDTNIHNELAEARRMASECLAEVRRSVAALRAADPTARSISEALATLADEFEAAQPETEVVLDVEGPVQALPTEMRIALYRAVQESLTNVRKHAKASKVLVRLRADHRCAELTILDNGIGQAAAVDGHDAGYGLLGMRERFALLNGTVSAQADPSQGWRVEIRVPVSSQAERDGEASVRGDTTGAATPALAATEG